MLDRPHVPGRRGNDQTTVKGGRGSLVSGVTVGSVFLPRVVSQSGVFLRRSYLLVPHPVSKPPGSVWTRVGGRSGRGRHWGILDLVQSVQSMQ